MCYVSVVLFNVKNVVGKFVVFDKKVIGFSNLEEDVV